MTTASAAAADESVVKNEDGHILCSTCKNFRPQQEFMKGNRLMKTCSAHRVSREANSNWAELTRHIKQAKSKGTEIKFSGRMAFSEYAAFNAVNDKSDTRSRSRACKRLMQELHRLTGYRFAYRNTWRLDDSWVAKCACAQDKTWNESKVFKPKCVLLMEEKDKCDCRSSLTIRLLYSIRIMEIQIDHAVWHDKVLEPPPEKGKKGKRPDKVGAVDSDDDDDDDNEDDETEAASLVGPSTAKVEYGVAGPSTMPETSLAKTKTAIPKFFPDLPSNANAQSFTQCYNTLHRAQQIMDEFKPYMLQGNNFSQFRQFFDGIDNFVTAYEAEKAKTNRR